MWVPLLQISLCTGKSPVAAPKVVPVSREFVLMLCSAGSPSDRFAAALSALRAFPLRHAANWPRPRAYQPVRWAPRPRRHGEAGRGGARGFYLSRRSPPAAGRRSPRSADREPTSAPAGTPGAGRWVPPTPCAAFQVPARVRGVAGESARDGQRALSSVP